MTVDVKLTGTGNARDTEWMDGVERIVYYVREEKVRVVRKHYQEV